MSRKTDELPHEIEQAFDNRALGIEPGLEHPAVEYPSDDVKEVLQRTLGVPIFSGTGDAAGRRGRRLYAG